MAEPRTPAERPVDLMIDLRERMIRIETMLEVKTAQGVEIVGEIVALKLRTTAIETQAVVLKTHINTLRWVGGLAAAFLGFFGSSIANLWQIAQ